MSNSKPADDEVFDYVKYRSDQIQKHGSATWSNAESPQIRTIKNPSPEEIDELTRCRRAHKRLRQEVDRLLVVREHLRAERNEVADLLCKMMEHWQISAPAHGGNAPTHCHEIPGVWDGTGEACAWCHLWARAEKRLTALREEQAQREE